jgi:hypothetical protein
MLSGISGEKEAQEQFKLAFCLFNSVFVELSGLVSKENKIKGEFLGLIWEQFFKFMRRSMRELSK